MDQTMDEPEMSRFAKWLLAKDERFYVLFLVIALIIFGVLSLLTMLVISGFVVAAFWLIFYFTVIKKK